MPAFPVEFEIILIIFSVIVILIAFKIKYKLNRHSLAFKVFFQVILSIGILVELVIIAIGLLNNEFFVVIFALPGGISFAIYVFWYLIKIINSQEKRIQELLQSSTETSINIANIATELASSANEVNVAAEEIASTTGQVANESKLVMESSNKIQKIMAVITNISEQTNLLALNASIEAAKAGEYGRGFTVVAEEVRKLSEVSRSSVENTYDEIKDIINKIHSTTASMEGISASTEEQTSSMEEITATANRLGALADELKEKLTRFTI